MLHAGIVWLRNGWNTWFSLKPLPHLLPAKVSSLRFDARMCKQRPREETTKRRDVTTEESQSLAINLHGTNVFFLWKCDFQKFEIKFCQQCRIFQVTLWTLEIDSLFPPLMSVEAHVMASWARGVSDGFQISFVDKWFRPSSFPSWEGRQLFVSFKRQRSSLMCGHFINCFWNCRWDLEKCELAWWVNGSRKDL